MMFRWIGFGCLLGCCAWVWFGCPGGNNNPDGGNVDGGVCSSSCTEAQYCDTQKGCRPRCASDKDCESKVEVCHVVSGRCVVCVLDTDCKTKEICRRYRCFADIPCKSSKHCPEEMLCSVQEERCVECLSETDCKTNSVCQDGVCSATPTSCKGTKDCKPLGQVCWTQRSQCVECLRHADCDQGQFCEQNLCKAIRLPISCKPGETACFGNLRKRCQDQGTSWDDVPCSPDQTCSQGVCQTKTCVPGESQCANPQTVRTCNPDGLTSSSSSCGAQEVCFTDRCVPSVCKPGEKVCRDEQTQQICDTTGAKWNNTPCPTDTSCQNGECRETPCVEGNTRSCYTGEAKTRDVGICKSGSQRCSGGRWATCQGETKPAQETCGNQQDDDCDGLVDEGCD